MTAPISSPGFWVATASRRIGRAASFLLALIFLFLLWPILTTAFDVNKHIEPKFILNVMQTHPQLFADLQPIPADVAIKPGFVFKP